MKNTLALSAAAMALTFALATPSSYAANILLPIDDLTEQSESATATVTAPGTFTGVNVGFEILDPGTTTISDLLLLQVGAGTEPGTTLVHFDFASDVEGGPPLDPTTFFAGSGAGTPEVITETGSFQTVYQDVVNPDSSLTVAFRSDVEGVPEPSTWAMMALGFGLLGGAGYWRRRSVAAA
jgi:hypothetical protein